jgi:hypothetical protein
MPISSRCDDFPSPLENYPCDVEWLETTARKLIEGDVGLCAFPEIDDPFCRVTRRR